MERPDEAPSTPSPIGAGRAPRRRAALTAGRVLLRIALPAVLLALVWHEVRALDWPQVRAEIARADTRLLALAVLAVGANVAAMGLYDAVSFPRAPRLGFFTRWGIGSLCFSWTNFLTIGPIGGPALRMVVYTRRGLTGAAIARGLVIQYVGFIAGLAAWLAAVSVPIPGQGPGALAARIGIAAALAPALSLATRRIGAWGLRLRRGDSRTAEALDAAPFASLGMVGFLDWGLSLASFWLVARAAEMPLDPFLTARTFFGGHLVGMLSMLPGGLGSADATWLLSLTEAGWAPDEAAAAVLLFRLLFYVLPWAGAVVVTVVLTAGRPAAAGRWRPRVIGAAVPVAAGFLLASAATPAVHERMAAVERAVPLWIVEASHAFAALSGALLVLLSPGLLHGSGRAARWTMALLAGCVTAHILKGGDVHEAAVSALLLVLVALARTDLRSGAPALPGRWFVLAAGLGALAFYLAFGFTAFVRVPLSVEAFTRFAHRAEASRFLRGGAVVAAGVLAAAAIAPSGWAARPRESGRAAP